MDNDKGSGLSYSSIYIAEKYAEKIATISSYKKEFIIDGHKIASSKWFLLSFSSITIILIGYAVILAIQNIITTSNMLVKIEDCILILAVSILIIYVIQKWRGIKK